MRHATGSTAILNSSEASSGLASLGRHDIARKNSEEDKKKQVKSAFMTSESCARGVPQIKGYRR